VTEGVGALEMEDGDIVIGVFFLVCTSATTSSATAREEILVMLVLSGWYISYTGDASSTPGPPVPANELSHGGGGWERVMLWDLRCAVGDPAPNAAASELAIKASLLYGDRDGNDGGEDGDIRPAWSP